MATNARSFLFLLCSLLFAHLSVADERIVTINPQAKFLTAEQNGLLRLYRAPDAADITINGVKSTLDQLLPGQTVVLKTVGACAAIKIAASGLGHASNSSSPLKLRSITVQIRVDGTDRVLYQDGKLWIEHLAAQKPTSIVINGIEWSPTWNGDKTEAFTDFVVPVAAINQGQIALKKYAGRGTVRLQHLVAAPVIVNIEDGHPGADDYEFQVSW
jgi:hypothetical protein